MDRINKFPWWKGRASALLFFIHAPRLKVQFAVLKKRNSQAPFVFLSSFFKLQKCHRVLHLCHSQTIRFDMQYHKI